MARVNRAFMHRATRWLAESGVRQFLDIGTGIPTEPNLHQIAQQAAPDARVVLLRQRPDRARPRGGPAPLHPEGVTEYIQADARKPETILAEAGKVLDFEQPIALSLLALLHFIDDEDGAGDLVDKLVDQLPSGSYLVLSHTTGDFNPEGAAQARAMYKERGMTLRPRSRAELTAFFDGLELVEPGVTLSADWRPELGEVIDVPGDEPIPGYAGVARKP